MLYVFRGLDEGFVRCLIFDFFENGVWRDADGYVDAKDYRVFRVCVRTEEERREKKSSNG